MPPSTPPRRVGLSFSLGAHPGSDRSAERAADPVQRVLIAADCSGRGARGLQGSIRERAVRRVDIDTFAKVCQGWRAEVSSRLGSRVDAPVVIGLADIEDLHPDQLLRNVAVLRQALQLRGLAPGDPDAAARLTELLARELASSSAEPELLPSAGVARGAPELGESSHDTLSRLLGGAPLQSPAASGGAASPSRVDVQGLIRSLVASSQTPPASASVDALVARTDEAVRNALRTILREPAFRSLEATWRGIDGLIRNCPDQASMEYSVIDASLTELAAEPDVVTRVLTDGAFSVLLVDHCFRPTAEELQALLHVLQACAAEQVTLVTGAHASLAGCRGFSEKLRADTYDLELSEPARAAWSEVLRLRSTGARLGLALPRFLLRQPYGASGEPLEQLAFEELVDVDEHEAFPWGNGAYLVVRALAHLHQAEGDPRHPDGSLDIRELPVVHLEDESGIRLQPSAEACLSDRELGQLRAAGFSILQGLRDSDRIRVHLVGLE
jgi:type VI secretion system protein ImpC